MATAATTTSSLESKHYTCMLVSVTTKTVLYRCYATDQVLASLLKYFVLV